MSKKFKWIIIVPCALALIGAFVFMLRNAHFSVLDPKGFIAMREKSIIIHALLLMLIPAVPVFGFLFFIIWKYREGNATAYYTPEHQGDLRIATLLWTVPSVIILAIGILNWQTTHELDPSKPLSGAATPLTIQVVSLQWKWLFIYPEQHIATVNFVEFPENTPINFELTSDAPMNSFWIPELGGQMYAMAGMSTKLHLIAAHAGEFKGRDAEISGAGFAGMQFAAKAATQEDFNTWVKSVEQGANPLDNKNHLDAMEYDAFSKPSMNNSVSYYSSVDKDLYNMIIMKYLSPTTSTEINMTSALPTIMKIPQ
jgi:cytochrome o ubiquinol oxidase subunit 2